MFHVSSKWPINLILLRTEAIAINKISQGKQNYKRRRNAPKFTAQLGIEKILMKMKVAPKVSLIKKRRSRFLFYLMKRSSSFIVRDVRK